MTGVVSEDGNGYLPLRMKQHQRGQPRLFIPLKVRSFILKYGLKRLLYKKPILSEYEKRTFTAIHLGLVSCARLVLLPEIHAECQTD